MLFAVPVSVGAEPPAHFIVGQDIVLDPVASCFIIKMYPEPDLGLLKVSVVFASSVIPCVLPDAQSIVSVAPIAPKDTMSAYNWPVALISLKTAFPDASTVAPDAHAVS